jgi:hypothetical protein
MKDTFDNKQSSSVSKKARKNPSTQSLTIEYTMSMPKETCKDETQSTPQLDVSPLIWIQGTGPGSRGSVLVNLAQNGYRREAHKIIGLSHIASLIGRDSDGGLPELWDVMGKRRNKRGITRLMAICITRGSLSPQRARALIRDHNVNVRATDFLGRTALHHALGSRYYKDPWYTQSIPINVELVRVLLEMDPDCVKEKDKDGFLPLHTACNVNAPLSVIKLLVDIYPEGVKEKCLYGRLPIHNACENNCSINVLSFLIKTYPDGAREEDEHGYPPCPSKKAINPIEIFRILVEAYPEKEKKDLYWHMKYHPAALVILSREKAVIDNSDVVERVAAALWFASSNVEVCISAGIPSALTFLARQEIVVTNYGSAAHYIAKALTKIASTDDGIQACISAGSMPALTALAHKMLRQGCSALYIKEFAETFFVFSRNDAGRQACINANVTSVLISLARIKDVIENAGSNIAGALRNIASSSIGRQSCLDSGVPATLVSLAREKAVMTSWNAPVYISESLIIFSSTAAGRQACIEAKAPDALTALACEETVIGHLDAATSVAKAFKAITGKTHLNVLPCNAKELVKLSTSRRVINDSREAMRVALALKFLVRDECREDIEHCINAGAINALIALARVKAVTENAATAKTVAQALWLFAYTYYGKEACVTAGTPSAFVMLAREKAVMNNGEAAKTVAGALSNVSMSNAGKRACVQADAPSALVALAREKAVKENGEAAMWVARALEGIAENDDGCLACIKADAPSVLTAFTQESSLMEIYSVVDAVANALLKIATSEAGRQACIQSGAPSALTSLAHLKTCPVLAKTSVANAFRAITGKELVILH